MIPRLYPVPNADAVDNPDGSITFSFTIWDSNVNEQVAGPFTITTKSNPVLPDIEAAVRGRLGQFLLQQYGLTYAQAFNTGVQAHTMPSEWMRWGE